MASDKKIALYYPYIDITDASLIKTAALYWDELQTIVPESISDPYKSPASKEAKQEGFLRSRIVHEMDDAVQKTGKEFVRDVKQDSVREHIVSIVRTTNPKEKKWTKVHFQKWAPQHLMKVWLDFRDYFPLSPTPDDFIIFPEPLANSYMSRLASVIAESDTTNPITSNLSYHNVLVDRYLDYSDERRSNQSQLANLSLQTISIDPAVPLIEILKFRNKNGDMLINFRRQIRELSRQIQIGFDTANKQKVFEEIITDKIVPVRREVEAKLEENNLKFVGSCITIALAGYAGIVFSGEYLGQLITAGILISAALIGNLRSERKVPVDNQLGYLYKAQQKLGGGS